MDELIRELLEEIEDADVGAKQGLYLTPAGDFTNLIVLPRSKWEAITSVMWRIRDEQKETETCDTGAAPDEN